jgi:hypothetical protein
MEETKQMKLVVGFPHQELTREQVHKLEDALKSAVVSVFPSLLESEVVAYPKVNNWPHEGPLPRP